MELKQDYIVLGLDNSMNCTGWSIVMVTNYNQMKLIDYGYINKQKLNNGEALILIEQTLIDIIEKYKPNYVAAEAPFVGKNRDTIQKLCYVHGVMLLTAAKYKLPVVYYAVMTMKSCVLGGIKTKFSDGTKKSGDDMKNEVKDKVIEIFGQENFKKDYTNDVTDSISAIVTFVKMKGQEIEKKKKIRVKKTTK